MEVMKILKATLSSKSREEVCRSENVPCCQEVLMRTLQKGTGKIIIEQKRSLTFGDYC